MIYYFKLNNNKHTFNLVGGKWYIKNNNYVNDIKDNNNITLITPLRTNSKKENINEDNKILLKDRSKVEQLIFYFKLILEKKKN